MQAPNSRAWIVCMSILLLASLTPAICYDLVDVEEMLLEAEDFGRSLLQTTGPGGYGGYGTGGGYGGYGGYGPRVSESALPPRVRTRTVCTNQTTSSQLQVFLALLQPTSLVNDSEVAQDSPSGMLTMYVDPRTGEAWLTADINNIQNLTAVTLNAGNVTESGPVVVPLVPNAASVDVDGNRTTIGNLTSNATLIQALWNSTFGSAGANGSAGDNTTQTPTVAVPTFQPALPWIARMQFSQKVFTNATLPLLANATVNNTTPGGANTRNTSAGNDTAGTSGINLSNTKIGVTPNQWANITQMINSLGSGNATVTTITKYSVNGSTSVVNISSGNNTMANQSTAGTNASEFNASNYNTTDVLALLQAGMAYVSVWTTQSGNESDLRGQMVPYGLVAGASPAISAAFPDALVPSPSYTTTVCRQVTEPAGQANALTGGAGRNVTTDVFGADAMGSNSTARARQVLPAVAAALTNITSRNDPNMKGNYSVFAAAVNAAAGLLGNASSQGGAAGGDAAGAGGNTNVGRRLLQGQAQMGAMTTAMNGTGGTGGITVFAPSNQAVAAFQQSVNTTQEQFLANKGLLLKIISFHIIPSEAIASVDLARPKNAVHQLKTLLPYNNIGYTLDRYGNATLYGANNTSDAEIVDANMRSGKVIVQGVDAVLLPPSLRSLAAGGSNATASGASNTTAMGTTSGNNQGVGRRLMKLLHLTHLM